MALFILKNIKSIYTKEDFVAFAEILGEMTSYVLNHKEKK
jgi:hypothetical protein